MAAPHSSLDWRWIPPTPERIAAAERVSLLDQLAGVHRDAVDLDSEAQTAYDSTTTTDEGA